MSHYIYRKKMFVETASGRIMPFALYSDSSLTRRFGGYEYHPASWCVLNLVSESLFPKKEDWQKAQKKLYADEIERLNKFNKEQAEWYGLPQENEATAESYCYSGNTFPGGGKVKNMRAFFSARNTIPAERFLEEYKGVCVSLEPLKPDSWEGYERIEVQITSEEEIERTESEYRRLLAKYPETRGICVGVTGLRIPYRLL